MPHKLKQNERVYLILLFLIFVAEVKCESLPNGDCAFAISSTGKRCVLEKAKTPKDDLISSEYECKTSEVMVQNMKEHIETDECIESCGLNRNFFGISSDDLLEPQFVSKLCAPACYQQCPNIVDLYFNLAAGEGKSNDFTIQCWYITR